MKKICKTLIICGGLLCPAILSVHAQERMATSISYTYLEKLIAIAKKNYPETRVKDLQVQLAKNNINRTAVGWLDALSFSYYYRPTNAVDISDPNLLNGYQLGLNINIGTLLQKPFDSKAAKLQYQAAQSTQTEYDQSIEATVKTRYFTYLEQLSQYKLRSKSYDDAHGLATLLGHKYEKGEATFDDYSRALLLEADQNQFMITAESGTLTAKTALEEIIGEKLEEVQ
jgi:outer membrane protein TolC